MRRPALESFTLIETEEKFSLRGSITMTQVVGDEETNKSETWLPSSPLSSIGLMSSDHFWIKVEGLDEHHQRVFSKVFESDSFGNFTYFIPKERLTTEIHSFHIFEISFREGIDLHMGTFIPLKIDNPKKIVISDFDKTLVDTKYSTTKEIYTSITRPLEYFPSLNPSIEILKRYIKEGHQPFILTASPHFYEKAIRDWLYQNEIYTAGIFLKDYRHVFSLTEGDLYPKDLKAQGFYKLNHLVNILLMTGIPNELTLLGDGFESDTLIYLLLHRILTEKTPPWTIWNEVKRVDAFKLTTKQSSHFLNKIFNLRTLVDECPGRLQKFNIYIRKKDMESQINIPIPALAEKMDMVEFYQA